MDCVRRKLKMKNENNRMVRSCCPFNATRQELISFLHNMFEDEDYGKFQNPINELIDAITSSNPKHKANTRSPGLSAPKGFLELSRLKTTIKTNKTAQLHDRRIVKSNSVKFDTKCS